LVTRLAFKLLINSQSSHISINKHIFFSSISSVKKKSAYQEDVTSARTFGGVIYGNGRDMTGIWETWRRGIKSY
jgi:hypothetical protein